MGKGELLGSGRRTTWARAEAVSAMESVAARISALAARETRFSSCIRGPLFDFSSNLVDGTVGGERGALLPADEMAGMVSGEVDAAVGFNEPGDRQTVAAAEAADPGAQIVRNHAPIDVDGFGELLAVAGVQQLDCLARGVQLGLDVGQLADRHAILDGVSADHDARRGEEFGAGIPDDRDCLIQVREAAVDVVVLLPESARLPGNLVAGVVGDATDDGDDVGGEVGLNGLKHRERHGADAVIGSDGLSLAALAVEIGDRDAVRGFADFADFGAIADNVAETLAEGHRNLVHAADGLEHGGLPVDHLLGHQALPQVGVEQGVHGKGVDGSRALLARAGWYGEAGTLGAFVEQVGLEIAVLNQKGDHALLVLCGNLLVEGALLDAFGEQLGDMAAGVVHHLPLLHWLPVVQVVGLHERTAGGVDFNLKRNAEFLAIAQHGGVDRRQAGGTDVLVVAFFKSAGLREAIGEFNLGTLADRPVASADARFAGLEQGTSIPKFSELVCGNQSGDAAAENHYARAVARHLSQG